MQPDPAFDALRADHPGLPLRRRRDEVRGLGLHLVEAGPEEGRPVLLLHGFPEFWWGWRHQLPALAAAGFRCLVPDLPGYNLSDKPRGLSSYGLDPLAEVVRDLLALAGPEPMPLVGHDWGGALAWWAALRFPERISRMAVLNIPHPAVLRRTLLRSREQRRRSRYMLYFQLPWLPERKLRAGGFRPFRAIFRRSSRRDTFSEAELDLYAGAAARPGALTAMLAWYRAALWKRPARPPQRRVEPPVLILWGTGDVALGEEMVEPSAARCRQAEVVRIEGAGHWVLHEAAEEVSRQLLAFLAPEPIRSSSLP
ncbi:MAG TPA: alpha/beta hydrolase [Thermoanaerobaculia bacterium]|nr:alpha/beta hydrolase [Thermoanaerobaculia bacterium]